MLIIYSISNMTCVSCMKQRIGLDIVIEHLSPFYYLLEETITEDNEASYIDFFLKKGQELCVCVRARAHKVAFFFGIIA